MRHLRKNDTVKDNSLIWEKKMKFDRRYVKKLYLFLKFDFQNSNYADHQILKRNRNIKNSFFVIKYRSCFTSKYFFILQMYFLECVKIIFENIFQSFASINFDIDLWWYLKEMIWIKIDNLFCFEKKDM